MHSVRVLEGDPCEILDKKETLFLRETVSIIVANCSQADHNSNYIMLRVEVQIYFGH